MTLNQVAFVITCKGRLDYLKQALPRVVALQPAEIVVVDYDCPQRTAQWVQENYPKVKIVKVLDAPIFNVSNARNLGAAASQSNWIFFSDADVIFNMEIQNWFSENILTSFHFFRQKPGKSPEISGTVGSCLVSRDSFELVGGYDDVITGWGFEDNDFYLRLKHAKINESFFDKYYFAAITHSDDKRMEFSETKDKMEQRKLNFIYSKMKMLIFRSLDIKALPRKNRMEILRQAIKIANVDNFNSSVENGYISVGFAPSIVNSDTNLEARLIFEFKCRPIS
jgi:glycosyltransferase involved in cell wall biosynthesis